MSSDTDSRWNISPAILERLVGNDREFREAVLVRLAEMGVKLESIQVSFEHHVKQDEERFGKVTMTMGENSGKLQWILGGAAMGGFLMLVIAGILRALT